MIKQKKRNVAIIGAGGRDFHNFLVRYKDNPLYDVKFFTATQIPGIDNRAFPKELAGRLYTKDIPIVPEDKLAELIEILQNDPFDSLLHTKPLSAPLQGLFSFRITRDYRVGDKIYKHLKKK